MTVTINGTTGYSGPVGTIGDLTTTGNTTLGDASSDTLTLNGNTASIPNGLNFTGGNIGIGVTSPSAQLQVNKTGTSDYTTFRLSNSGASGKTYEIGVGGNAAAAGYANNLYFYDSTAGALRMILDTSGNLGLGVTPSAWSSGRGVLQLKNNTSLTDSSGAGIWGYNWYNDGSANKYIASDYASRLIQSGGGFQWAIAASGTAGNTISFTQAMTLDASGRLGIGVTSMSYSLEVNGFIRSQGGGLVLYVGSANTGIVAPYYKISGSGTDYSTTIFSETGQGIYFCMNGSATKAMTLGSGGDLAIGGATKSGGGGSKWFTLHGTGSDYSGGIVYALDNVVKGYHYYQNGFLVHQGDSGIGHKFYASGTDCARIASNGFAHFSNSGSYYNPNSNWHSMETSLNDNAGLFINTHATQPYGPFIWFRSASPNNTTQYFLAGSDTTNDKFFIYSNGTFASRTNTYGGISDIKVKQDIVDAPSQWNDIKGLRFRKYRFKDDPTGPLQLGLISQEAELVSPGLVFDAPDIDRDEEGNVVETGEVTKHVKYSIVYMKAVVALQEAMNRIEQLEADFSAYKQTHP